MLETLAKQNLARDMIRFANLTHLALFATKMGLTIDEVTEVISFERDDATKELMDGPFEMKPKLGNKFGTISRFSDGEWPVFYAAIGRETAEKESSHHYGRKAAGDVTARRAVHYSVVRCTYAGETIDLTAQLSSWPELVSENLKFCNVLEKRRTTPVSEDFWRRLLDIPEGLPSQRFCAARSQTRRSKRLRGFHTTPELRSLSTRTCPSRWAALDRWAASHRSIGREPREATL